MMQLFTKRKKTSAPAFFASLSLLAVTLALMPGRAFGQCGFQAGEGCPGTNYNNYGYASDNDFLTIEYDNYISAFHSTIVRTYDGSFKAWGEGMMSTGVQSSGLLTPTTIGPSGTSGQNFNYGTNNKILKAALASNFVNNVQAVILTQQGLYVWGQEGQLVDGDLTTSTGFQAISSGSNGTSIINGNTWDLPGTIEPQQVKMMFATGQTLAIVTCDGQAWVLSLNSTIRHGLANSGGGGSTNANRTWVRVSTASGVPLQNVVALRGVRGMMFAMTWDGTTQNLYTWGFQTHNGSTGPTDQNYATLMNKPEGVGTIKMIGATKGTDATTHTNYTYYVLATSGKLFAMGNNAHWQLGDWTTDAGNNGWVRPKYPDGAGTAAGADMDNIKWFSPNEHDGRGWAGINVIDAAGQIWNWGTDVGIMLGRSSSNSGNSYSNGTRVRPGKIRDSTNPSSEPGGVYTSVETGGHTTMATRECVSKFGYVGHAIRGSAGHDTGGEAIYYDALIYNTDDIQVCGATTDAVITIEGGVRGTGVNYCSNMQPLTLVGSPAGGTFSLVGTPPTGVTLTGNVLSFTGSPSGSVTVKYVVSSGEPCNEELETDITIGIETCSYNYVRGTVWNDVNNDASLDGGENGFNPGPDGGQLYANLVFVDPVNGDKIAASIKVSADGTYELPATYGPGTYRVEITNKLFGANVPASAIVPADRVLPTGLVYTGTNISNANLCTPPCATPYTIAGIEVDDVDVNGHNFGIQQPPVAVDHERPIQENPGGEVSVPVPPTAFNGTDPDGEVEKIRITEFPEKTTSITIGTTTYYPTDGDIPGVCPTATCLAFPEEGVIVDADEEGHPAEDISVDPEEEGYTSVIIKYTVIDNGGLESNPATVTLPFGIPYKVEGNVFHDPDGGNVNNSSGGANTVPAGIYANLLDEEGNVLQSTEVGTNGEYTFENVFNGTYTVALSSTEGTEGNPPPAFAPEDWVYTGDYNGVPDSGNDKDGDAESQSFTVDGEDVDNINFAIQQPPTATDNSKAGITGNPVTIPTITNDDSDPEDGSIDPTTVSLIVPDGATDVEEEDGRVKGFKVPGEGTWEVDENGNATFTPEEGFTDDPTPIKYTVEDEAGAKSNEATLTVTYGPAISISGKVWHDVDGDAGDSGEVPVSGGNDDNGGTSSVTGGTVYANLVEGGKVVASVQVNNDGTYVFNNVVSNSDYKVILTKDLQTPGNDLDDSDASIPDDWEATGTNWDGSPNQGNKTNVIDLGTVTTDVENANFGIQQPPVSDDSEYVIARPASDDIIPLDGTVAAITPAGLVNPPVGSDPDATDDAKASIVITRLPYVPDGQEADAEPVLYYDGDEVNETNFPGLVIEEFDPALFSVELKGKGYNQVSFDFKVVDAAGSESEESTYTLRWTGTLPVKWQDISVVEEQGHAVVSWRTVEELNVASYNVLYSANARNWQTVGTLKAGKISRSYNYTHTLSGNGVHYFRIQSVDLDGSTSLSRVVSLQGKAVPSSVYPNPVLNGRLTLDLPVTSGKVKVYSLTGAEVLNTTLQGNVLNVRNLSAGQYILQVTSESGETITRTFIVK